MTHKLFICETCLGADGQKSGADIADAVVRLLNDRGGCNDVDVIKTPCLNICDEPVSLALRAQGKMAYLFSGIEREDVHDIAVLVDLYVQAKGGVIEDARPAGRLRFCLKGRIPAE